MQWRKGKKKEEKNKGDVNIVEDDKSDDETMTLMM